MRKLVFLPIVLFAAISHRCIFGHQYQDFDQCIDKEKVDGCSIPFNTSFPYRVVFKPACNRHDVCYRCGKSFGWSRKDCDSGFLYDLYRECEAQKETRRRKVESKETSEAGQDDDHVKKSITARQSHKVKATRREKSSQIGNRESSIGQEITGQESRKRGRRVQRSNGKGHSNESGLKRSEREDSFYEEVAQETAMKREKIKKKCKGLEKKREWSIHKKAPTKEKVNQSHFIRHTEEPKDKNGEHNKIKTTKYAEFRHRDHKAGNGSDVKQFHHKNYTLEAPRKPCNKSHENCNVDATQHLNTSHLHEIKNEKTLKYNQPDLDNNTTSRHEKILKILTWLDDLLRSEKEMYAHRKNNKEKPLSQAHSNSVQEEAAIKHGHSRNLVEIQKMEGNVKRKEENLAKKEENVKKKEENLKKKEGKINKREGIKEMKIKKQVREEENMKKKRTRKPAHLTVDDEDMDEDRKKEVGVDDVINTNNLSKKEREKRVLNHCKLTAHLYFLAVRGFGKKFYRKEPASWCDNSCVKRHGIPHIKKYHEARKMM